MNWVFKNFFTEALLICVSFRCTAVIQLHVYTCMYICIYIIYVFFRFFSILDYCKILSIVPCAIYRRSLLIISEKAMATHSSTPAWKIPWTEEPGRLQSMGSLRIGDDWATSLSCIGEGNGSPLQCSCLENPRDRGAWWAAVYGVAQSRTRLKQLSSSSS